jgi:hypothetical protein
MGRDGIKIIALCACFIGFSERLATNYPALYPRATLAAVTGGSGARYLLIYQMCA